ncbi:hypothetical protein Scep_027257 [Stephania cephalantha]|uniref:Bulb-type lectin domain-containing protein n=1 Tax=Stephania cephalantha TaxID=152367 RepID=A0AAP0EA09_9MAGN
MRATHLCFIISALLLSLLRVRASTLELAKGFAATPDSSISSFQSFLVDPNGNFSFGFLRIQQSRLALAVLHAASSEPIWVANTSTTQWADSTTLIFNGRIAMTTVTANVVVTTGYRQRCHHHPLPLATILPSFPIFGTDE